MVEDRKRYTKVIDGIKAPMRMKYRLGVLPTKSFHIQILHFRLNEFQDAIMDNMIADFITVVSEIKYATVRYTFEQHGSCIFRIYFLVT